MNQRKSLFVAAGLAVLLTFSLACGAVTSLIGGGSGKSASDLWSDVPAMPGMTKQAGELPLPIKLAVQAMAKASTANEDTQIDNLEFIAFTSSKGPEDLKAFYTLESMQAQGWTLKDQPGCNAGDASQAQVPMAGGFCLFGRDDGNGKSTVLIILAGKEEGKSESNIYFARLSGTIKQK
jgi:hypothetical protein